MRIGMIFAAAIVLAALSAPCDIASDTWVATDGLGRSLPTAAEAGLPRTNRTVAVFYFINRPTDENVPGPFDVSKILSADPDALKKPDSPLWGPMCCNHWWGEPLFGYYCSNDPFVLRKHAQMLGDAGVDVIVFDVSNGPTFDASWQEIVRVFADVRASGGHTPQIAFLCPFPAYPPYGLRGGELRHLWRTLYEPGIHPELWFRWKGKPLVIAHPCHRPSCIRRLGAGGERLRPGRERQARRRAARARTCARTIVRRQGAVREHTYQHSHVRFASGFRGDDALAQGRSERRGCGGATFHQHRRQCVACHEAGELVSGGALLHRACRARFIRWLVDLESRKERPRREGVPGLRPLRGNKDVLRLGRGGRRCQADTRILRV